ncbi:hypothetical protein [Bacillus sp. Marseille-P3661]|uniref:hypothetical protein n=1 Tax=Bacillus sp. Marseille-P3661 TaxID=1936234 RepID=UPI000C850FFB|nr:hypothetical protein [Bacillus sp. Marseille-P3661]
MDWGNIIVESKAFRVLIKSAFWTSIVIGFLILLMIASFIIKLTFLDYKFDDGELKPPVQHTSKNNLY